MRYANMSGLPEGLNTPDHWALGFCVFELLAGVRDQAYYKTFDRLFNGEGFFSDEGWELCRVSHRYLGAEVELPTGVNDSFLVWTDPTDFGYQPSWRVYSEEEFKAIFPRCCIECQKQAGRSHEPKLVVALEAFCS